MSRFKVQYLGNTKERRTEAEVVDSTCPEDTDPTCAVLHDSGAGIEIELLPHGQELRTNDELKRALEDARSGLLRYVNRRGENSPRGLSVAGLSLWLLEKDDGTAMGAKIR